MQLYEIHETIAGLCNAEVNIKADGPLVKNWIISLKVKRFFLKLEIKFQCMVTCFLAVIKKKGQYMYTF